MTDKQIEALKYFIAQSKNATDFCKKAVLLLINESENLTRPVRIPFNTKEKNKELARGMLYGVHDMCSSNGTTHLGSFCQGMGTVMRFNSWTDSSRAGTIAISPDYCRLRREKVANSKKVRFNKKRIEVINLSK